MEHTVPAIMELLRGVRTDVADDMRRMPDLGIQHPKSKAAHCIAVKFRADGCLSAAELKDGHSITTDCRNYLGNPKEFELNRQIISNLCEFAVRFSENVRSVPVPAATKSATAPAIIATAETATATARPVFCNFDRERPAFITAAI